MNPINNTSINLLSLMESLGLQPVKNRNHKFWFTSPLRNETNASFIVDAEKNLWYDFGLGEGGNAITLVCRIHNVDTKEALQIISGKRYAIPENMVHHKEKRTSNSTLKIIKASPQIQKPALIEYLRKRKIDYRGLTGCKQLKELHYSIEHKNYFAIGFENDRGGYEIRNAFWKGSSSPKSITTIKGNPTIVNVFEGFMDYLSALTFFETAFPSHTSIVLNGTGQIKTLLALLPAFQKAHLYLDNDEAGKRVVAQINEAHQNVINQSMRLYPNHKDFNEFLCSN
jgi:DNA primase